MLSLKSEYLEKSQTRLSGRSLNCACDFSLSVTFFPVEKLKSVQARGGEGMANVVERRGGSEPRARREECREGGEPVGGEGKGGRRGKGSSVDSGPGPGGGLAGVRCRVMLKGCRGWSGDGLPATIGFISSGGYVQGWFASSQVEVMTI